MAILKIVFMIAITMALTLTLTLKSLGNYEKNPISVSTSDELISSFPVVQDLKMVKLPKRVSRFLAEQPKNPRAADHCHKDNEICYILEGKNSTCCNNKCMDLSTDSKNCGACKSKCKYTETCCQGECVNLAYDKRHCGICGNKCMTAGYCLYGLCDYA